MNLNLFIAKKIKGSGLSSTSNGIACVSVAISIAVILAAVAISGGFKKEIGKRAAGFTGEILMTVPGVESVNETAYKPGMIKEGSDVHGVMFKGVDSTYSLDFFADFLTDGALPDFSGERISDQVLISKRLAVMLDCGVGDRIAVYFIGEQVRVRKLVIAGLYDIQLEDMDERLALMDIRSRAWRYPWAVTEAKSQHAIGIRCTEG